MRRGQGDGSKTIHPDGIRDGILVREAVEFAVSPPVRGVEDIELRTKARNDGPSCRLGMHRVFEEKE